MGSNEKRIKSRIFRSFGFDGVGWGRRISKEELWKVRES